MNALTHLAMFGWIPAVLVLFALLPARRAVLTAFVAGWLFLPMAAYKVGGLPPYTKMMAVCGGVMLGVLLFDSARVLAFRPRWFDLPMAVWCLCPIASSLSNGLGLHDGLSAALGQSVTWGVPYLIGRWYFTDAASLRELALALLLGGLAYVPLCLFEMRMSPQLHAMFYGYRQHSFAQCMRDGGYRPMVFMQHGLMVAMWMTGTSLVGLCLWRSGTLRKVAGLSPAWLVLPLVGTTVLCKSAGALGLLLVGMAALWACRWRRSCWPALLLIAVAPLFVGLRVSGTMNGETLVNAATAAAGPERAASLAFRMRNENALVEKALRQPAYGWGGWGRSRLNAEDEQDGPVSESTSITDSMWIIAIGKHGLVGLVSLGAALLLPAAMALFRRRLLPQTLAADAALVGLAVLLVLYSIDCVFNAMINPVFLLVAGGVASVAARRLPWPHLTAVTPQLQAE